MVSLLLNVRHDVCSLCGATAVPLFTLKLEAGREPRIDPTPANVHSGICEGCLARIGAMLRNLAVRA